MRRKGNGIILGGLALALVLTGCAGGGGGSASPVETIRLQRESIENTVTAAGMVYSTRTVHVCSNANLPVKSLHASLGQPVKEGDLLVEFDTSGLEDEIASLRASAYASQVRSGQAVVSAENELARYKKDLAEGRQQTVLDAEARVAAAQADLETAKATLASARRDLRAAREYDYDDAYDMTEFELNGYLAAVTTAEAQVSAATVQLASAEKALAAARNASQAEVGRLEEDIETAKAAQYQGDSWARIQQLEQDVSAASLQAPMDGTITRIQTGPGQLAAGQLLTIQDTGALQATLLVEEYNVPKISVGDRVRLKAEMLEGEIAGTVATISPTSLQTAGGDKGYFEEVLYEVDVAIGKSVPALKIGMNVNGDIVLDNRTGVFVVPYEAIAATDSGHMVYVAAPREQEGGAAYIVEEIPVTLGVTNGPMTEIMAGELEEGMEIIRDPYELAAGQEVAVTRGE